MTSATDALRAMLDERGVEYDTRDGKAVKNTYWNDGNGRRWGYTEDVTDSGITSPTLFLVSGQLIFTPTQAVEATLGRGTCEVVSSILHEYEGGYAGQEWEHELSCGHTVWWGGGDAPEWCPWCGREVVGE